MAQKSPETPKPPPDRCDPEKPTYPDRDGWDGSEPTDPVGREDPIPPPNDGEWRDDFDEWVDRRKEERAAEREKDRCGRDRGKHRMPRPWLDATSNFAPHLAALALNEAGTVTFTVWNDGSFPAWTCYVDVYEGPGGYTTPLSDYELRDREIITLHPGERREVTLSWVRKRTTGRIVGVVYDPLLDPRDFALVEQFNRHITSVHYVNLP